MKKRMNRFWGPAVVAIGAALIVSACTGTDQGATNSKPAESHDAAGNHEAATEATTEREVTDALGHKVKVPAQPQRVLATYLEDNLVALGVKPVAQWSVGNGTSIQDYLQDELKGIPIIPHDLPYEVVMGFEPDLIIIDSVDMIEGEKYAKYAEIAPTYVVGGEKNNDWRKELLAVGDVLNRSDKAKQVLADYEAKVKAAKEQLQQKIGQKSAAALWVTDKAIYAPSKSLSSGDVLYNDLGFTTPNVIEEISKTAKANWNAVSPERIAELNADYLFLINSKPGTKEKVLSDPMWQGIPAVKNGHVYAFDQKSSWLYTGSIANAKMIDDVLNHVLK